jgi:hypothetical protein
MARKKTPKNCEFMHNQMGLITKVLIPVEILEEEYNSTLLDESPLFKMYKYIEEFNEEGA